MRIARAFAHLGARTVLVDINQDKLDEAVSKLTAEELQAEGVVTDVTSKSSGGKHG